MTARMIDALAFAALVAAGMAAFGATARASNSWITSEIQVEHHAGGDPFATIRVTNSCGGASSIRTIDTEHGAVTLDWRVHGGCAQYDAAAAPDVLSVTRTPGDVVAIPPSVETLEDGATHEIHLYLFRGL